MRQLMSTQRRNEEILRECASVCFSHFDSIDEWMFFEDYMASDWRFVRIDRMNERTRTSSFFLSFHFVDSFLVFFRLNRKTWIDSCDHWWTRKTTNWRQIPSITRHCTNYWTPMFSLNCFFLFPLIHSSITNDKWRDQSRNEIKLKQREKNSDEKKSKRKRKYRMESMRQENDDHDFDCLQTVATIRWRSAISCSA